MAYDEELANRLREALQAERGLTERPMFGGLAFLIGGNMAVSASGHFQHSRHYTFIGREFRFVLD